MRPEVVTGASNSMTFNPVPDLRSPVCLWTYVYDCRSSPCPRVASCNGGFRNGSNRLPSGKALENALGILDRVDVAVMFFNHLNRGAHLLREPVNVDSS
jgi:hypothetical protein